jgi:virginiamycin B lyase
MQLPFLFWLLTSVPPPDVPPSSAWLNLLPDGVEKREFVLDCTGCHQLAGRFAWAGDRARTEAEWQASIEKMLSFAGASAGFPVISADRQAAPTAAWLATNLKTSPTAPTPAAPVGRAVIREYPLPAAGDLPHDLGVDPASGQVLITGMFTHRLWILDPASGVVAADSIPLAQANPRALEPGRDGRWWVALGGPQRVASYDPRTKQWASYPIGMYPHSIGVDSGGRIWFNGHFTRDPELIGRVDPATGATKTYQVPKHPRTEGAWGPLPYELRVAPNGHVWLGELQGNRIVELDPATERFTVHDLPTPASGPRRFDFDRAGTLWIPAYAASLLVRFEPATGRFTEYRLPIADALPYVARVDHATGLVWIATAAADVVFSFDPRTARFVTYPLPSRGALVRHMVVDGARRAIWLAYGASPGEIPARVARLEPR